MQMPGSIIEEQLLAAPCPLPRPRSLIWGMCKELCPTASLTPGNRRNAAAKSPHTFPKPGFTPMEGRREEQGRGDGCKLNTCTAPPPEKIPSGGKSLEISTARKERLFTPSVSLRCTVGTSSYG